MIYMNTSKLLFCAFPIAILIAVLSFISCKRQEYKYIVPDAINYALYEIDSVNNTVGIELQFYEVLQSTYDSARVVWDDFERLCHKCKYEKAYDMYQSEENENFFYVYLKESPTRYKFLQEVIWPMIFEFNEIDTARQKYIRALELEYVLESSIMKNTVGENVYVPERFLELVYELGTCNCLIGKIDYAMGLVDDFAFGLYVSTQNCAYVNKGLTVMVADFYSAYGDHEQSIKTLQDYKEYTSQHIDPNRDPLEYQEYFEEIDKYIVEQQELLQQENNK